MRPQYRDYIGAIDGFADGYFDIIAVDGKERVGCTVHAVPKLKAGGVLVLDDSEREEYEEVFALLSAWSACRLGFGLRQTTLFVKPQP